MCFRGNSDLNGNRAVCLRPGRPQPAIARVSDIAERSASHAENSPAPIRASFIAPASTIWIRPADSQITNRRRQAVTGTPMLRMQYKTVSAFALALAVSLPLAAAYADVTTQQKTTMNLGITKMSVTETDQFSGDKQRSESESHCDGMMSLVCGKNKSAHIVRLDKSVDWDLRSEKKTYTERPFPTAAEQAAFLKKMQDMMKKMKECPTPAAPDNNCELSTPKLEVKATEERATIAGHDAKKTAVTFTQTSTCKDTGNVCEITYGFDSWLTSDTLPGTDEQRAFQQRYMKQMGFTSESNMSIMKGMSQASGGMSSPMGPYMDMMTQLRSKASALKGTPLRTTFRMTMGGEKCGEAKQAQAGAGQEAAPSAGTVLGGIVGGPVGQLGGKLLGGMFGKKKPDAPADGTSSGAAPAAAQANVVTMIETTTETVSIDTTPIAGSRFEIPDGFKKEQVTEDKSKDEDFTCPAQPGGPPGGKGSKGDRKPVN